MGIWIRGGDFLSVSRMFEMVYILLERDRITAAELAKRLEVSVRTVYRDAQALSEAGVPIYAERGREGGLCILPSFKLSRALLSEEDRRVILSSLTAMEQSGTGSRQTLQRLSSFLGAQPPDWIRIDLSDWSGQQDLLIETIKAAILERRLLQFDYYAESGAMTARTVCPLRLLFKGRAWYLQAYCLKRNAARTFRLTRLKRAQIVSGEFPPEVVLPDEAVDDNSGYPPCVVIRVRIDARMAYRVYDDFEEDQITRTESGDFVIDAAYPPGAWIASIILSYGEHAEVLSPPALREEVARKIKKLAEIYKC